MYTLSGEEQRCDPVWERDITHLGQTYWEIRLKRIALCQRGWEFLEGSTLSLQVSEQGWGSGNMIQHPALLAAFHLSLPRPPRHPLLDTPEPPGFMNPARWVLASNWQRLPHFCRINKKHYWVF